MMESQLQGSGKEGRKGGRGRGRGSKYGSMVVSEWQGSVEKRGEKEGGAGGVCGAPW